MSRRTVRKRHLPSVCLAVVMATSCSDHDDSAAAHVALPAAVVRVHTVEAQTSAVTEEVVGTIRAKLQARIEARVAGRIVEMRAVPGRTVHAGQVLVRLDLEEARARLDQALAVREQTASDLQRYSALLERSAATRAEFDAAQARARVAEAVVGEARTMLGHSAIVAPYDGVVTRKLADIGDLAVPGKTLLELEDPKVLRVEASVGEASIDRITIGQTLEVRVPALTAPLRGTVAELAPAADTASRTFLMALDLPPTPGLRAGTFARVAVPVGEATIVRVPAGAVFQRGQLELVFVATAGQAALRLVRTGKRHEDEIEIIAGISSGEQVVISGGAQLREGQPLQLRP